MFVGNKTDENIIPFITQEGGINSVFIPGSRTQVSQRRGCPVK